MMLKQMLSFMLCLCLGTFLFAAETHTGCEANTLVNGASHVVINQDKDSPRNGGIQFVKLKEPLAITLGEMNGWLKNVLNTNAKTDFQLEKQTGDKVGYTHYRFKQTYDGYVVNNGVYYIHVKGGKIISANGEFYPNVNVSTTTNITAEKAIEIGKEHIHGHKWAWEDGKFPIPELNISVTTEGHFLTYKTDIYSKEPLDRKWLMIDVATGDVVAEYNRIHSDAVEGEAHCKYHGTQTIVVDSVAPQEYILRDNTRGGGVETYDMNEDTDYGNAIDFTDSDNIWNTTTNHDDAALDAHWGTEMMYDYMLNAHGWESYDGNGTVMLSYVHYGESFYNAFWDGQAMTYGDGDGVNAFPLTSTEVVGHEIMHGVTENSAGLIYSDESGGLNESYSDCFGVILDYKINSATANFLMGDDFSATGTPFRNLGNPNEYENPDTYNGLYWDFNEPHNWSGVQNFWFYLVTQGGAGTNDIGNDYVVNGFPMEDAAAILFRSLETYLTPNTTYEEARFYSIMSANDLFGDCSEQVINVTNGWYAVGVGDLYDDASVAGFYSDATYNCTFPVSVDFTNASINGSLAEWDFGNGTTSTAQNPTAIYTAAGTYTVTLISTGSGLACGDSDTLVLVDYITIDDVGAPNAVSCAPGTDFPTDFQGVFKFELENINNLTGGGEDGYQDYSCTYIANVTEGILYPFTINTGFDENISVWIDVDNDGVFNNTNELVYQSVEPSANHIAQLIIPDTDLYGQNLRLRIKSDGSGYDVSDPCVSANAGQIEDYGLLVSENVLPPSTEFVANFTAVQPGTTIDFTDLTQNLPNSWYWEFDGGTPATSTAQHPSVTYNTLGLYPVSLMATNAFGNDIELKTEYILVSHIATMCTNVEANSEFGIFLDSGGDSNEYSNEEYCTFLIAPDCAEQVMLEFTAFSVEAGWDYLYVYDGVDNTAPSLGVFDGNALPGTLTATSGKMFIVFISDGSVTRSGWEANWTSVIPTTAPTADFSISNINTPANVSVEFTDLSTEFPNLWAWDFGDGGISTEQNPAYVYNTPGTYTIELITGNCFDFDTVSHTIVVQDFASITVDPTTIEVDLSCGNSVTVPVTVSNNGMGDLVFNFDGESGGSPLDSVRTRLNANFESLTDLMPNYYAFSGGDFGFEINDGGGDMYDGGNHLSVDGTGLMNYSEDLVIPNADMGMNGQYFTKKHPGLFVFAADIDNVDLFSIDGNLGADGSGEVTGAVLDVTHNGSAYKGFVKRVHDAFDPSINHLIIVEDNGNLTQVIPTGTSFDDHDVFGLTGSSRIYYLLFAEGAGELYSDDIMEAVMTQFLEIIGGGGLLEFPTGTYVLSGGSSETFDFLFDPANLENGTYTSTVSVNSNDPSFNNIEIGVTVNVNNSPCTDFGFTLIEPCEGIVQFSDLSENATSWSWDFGDGSTASNLQNPSHNFTENGTYDVVLTATNAFGSETFTLGVTINDQVSAEIQMQGLLEPNQAITFEGVSTDAISWSWDFGDGMTSNEQMPSHAYASDGEFTVTLTVTNAVGCTFTVTELVSIIASGIAELEAAISLYPNPTNGDIYIRNTSSESFSEIEIVNAIGQVLKRIDTNHFSGESYHLELSDLSPGVYVLGIKFGENEVLRKKIVVHEKE